MGPLKQTSTQEPPYPKPTYAWYVVVLLLLSYIVSWLDRQILSFLIGPPLVGLITDGVFGDEAALKYSLAAVLIIMAAPVFYLLMRGLKNYRTEMVALDQQTRAS